MLNKCRSKSNLPATLSFSRTTLTRSTSARRSNEGKAEESHRAGFKHYKAASRFENVQMNKASYGFKDEYLYYQYSRYAHHLAVSKCRKVLYVSYDAASLGPWRYSCLTSGTALRDDNGTLHLVRLYPAQQLWNRLCHFESIFPLRGSYSLLLYRRTRCVVLSNTLDKGEHVFIASA